MRPNRKSSVPHSNPKQSERASGETSNRSKQPPTKRIGPKLLRIIGGELKRRNVLYNGDLQTRPMKDSVRENLFNILGKAIEDAVAWDLFAGTGIIAIESISRGAKTALAVDVSRECTFLIRKEATKLGIQDRLDAINGDAFKIAPTRLKFEPDQRRVVFCCPPYKFWDSKRDQMNLLIHTALECSAPGSIVVAETDNKYNPELLPTAEWDVRTYGNTRLAIAEKPR